MSLLGLPFLLLVGVLSLLALAGTWLLWNRWPGTAAIPGRAVSLLLVMVMGGLAAGAYANHTYGFYSSLGDLLGSVPAQQYQPPRSFGAAIERAGVVVDTPDWQALVRTNAAAGHGTLLRVTFPGPTSGITRRALLYLPAAYVTGGPRLYVPAIEFFNGYPGKPSNFPKYMNLGTVVDGEIAAHRMPPAIIAIPTVYEHHSSECVDGANGEKDETYLAVDVPADLEAGFRVQRGRSFGALGYSEGGFCAANLGLHHPDRYGAVVSLSGYFTAGIVPSTVQPLYGHNRAALNRNSPLWWVQHRHPTGPAMFVMSSTGDPSAVHDARQFRNAARRYAPRLPVVAPLIVSGGHNFHTWLQAFPAALDFLGANLPAALAPPYTLPQMPG